MKILIFCFAAAGLMTCGISLAQTTPGMAPVSGSNNQAVATTSDKALMPAKGANSFTMGEARSRAQKDGGAASVWLDYKGNVGATN